MAPDTRSTDEFAQGAFRPHGRLEVRTEGAIVYADGYGPFNTEFVKAMARTLRELRVTENLPRSYGRIVQFHGSLMGSKELLDQLSITLGQVHGHQIARAVAFVVAGDVEGRDFMLPLLERIFLDKGRNFRSFDKLPEAEDWVRDCLKAAEDAGS